MSCGASSSQVWVKCTLYPGRQRASLLAISRVEVIGRGDELSCWQGRLLPPSPTLIEWLKLLLPDATKCADSGQRFHPLWGARSLERIEQHPAVSSDLIGVLLALLLLPG